MTQRLYQIKNGQAVQLSDKIGWWKFLPLIPPDQAIAGTYTGLVLLQKRDGLWQEAASIKGFDESSRIMEFDQNGDLWVTHGYKGAYRITISDDHLSVSKVELFDHRHGFQAISISMSSKSIKDSSLQPHKRFCL